MRFHLDEHVANAVAAGLRRRGIDVTSTADAGLLSADDEEHLAFAMKTNRVVVTNDADFLRLTAKGHPHLGVVFSLPDSRTIGEIVRFLTLMHDCLEESEMINKVQYF